MASTFGVGAVAVPPRASAVPRTTARPRPAPDPAARRARRSAAPSRLEDARQVVGRDAAAGVGDAQHRRVALRLGLHVHRAARPGCSAPRSRPGWPARARAPTRRRTPSPRRRSCRSARCDARARARWRPRWCRSPGRAAAPRAGVEAQLAGLQPREGQQVVDHERRAGRPPRGSAGGTPTDRARRRPRAPRPSRGCRRAACAGRARPTRPSRADAPRPRPPSRAPSPHARPAPATPWCAAPAGRRRRARRAASPRAPSTPRRGWRPRAPSTDAPATMPAATASTTTTGVSPAARTGERRASTETATTPSTAHDGCRERGLERETPVDGHPAYPRLTRRPSRCRAAAEPTEPGAGSQR